LKLEESNTANNPFANAAATYQVANQLQDDEEKSTKKRLVDGTDLTQKEKKQLKTTPPNWNSKFSN
jgi:hypothetical protein